MRLEITPAAHLYITGKGGAVLVRVEKKSTAFG